MTLTGAAKLAGVMGWPVSHSLSPRLHGYWLQEYGIDGAYVPMAVKPDDFQTAVRALPKLGFQGANVTVPHKEAALSAVDELSAEAKGDRRGQYHHRTTGRTTVRNLHRRRRIPR